MNNDFVAIGDTTVDEFIRLKDASVHCDVNREHCTISMRWGDKIPYEYAVTVAGVGNAANAAVAAARLGLKSGFLSNVGKDPQGDQVLESLRKDGVDTTHVAVNDGATTNHHYVLWYEAERTILIKHETYPYAIPEGFVPPRWIYLSSAGERSEAFHGQLAAWLAEHPETKLAFQPGTFQISMGTEKLADLYARTTLFASNKEEAERILGLGETEPKELLTRLHALGPKIVLVTDGPGGSFVSDGTRMLFVPMYPDPKPPFERTGAGDAMTSTVVVALALGLPLEEALAWGPVNAMAVVQEIGAQKGLLTRDALEKVLREAPESYRVTPLE